MKFLNKLKELRDSNAAAARASRAVLEQANRHGADAELAQGIALERLEQATEQAKRLSGADPRNHYSESLTHAFRGRTA
jgi:hypothetical protein